MPEPQHRARRREIEVELEQIRSQLRDTPAMAQEVKDHLQAKQAALETELGGILREMEAKAASQE